MSPKLELVSGMNSQASAMSVEHVPSSAYAGLVRANSVVPPVVLVPPAPPAPMFELLELVPPAPVVELPVVELPVVELPVVALAVVALPVVEALLVLAFVAVVAEAVVATVLLAVVELTVALVWVAVLGPVVTLESSVESESLELHAGAATKANGRSAAETRKL